MRWRERLREKKRETEGGRREESETEREKETERHRHREGDRLFRTVAGCFVQAHQKKRKKKKPVLVDLLCAWSYTDKKAPAQHKNRRGQRKPKQLSPCGLERNGQSGRQVKSAVRWKVVSAIPLENG